MVGRYRAVLEVDGCVRLLATALLGRLPQGMSTLAILLLVRGATHSYAAAGLATGGYALASAVASPPQGRLVDRLGRARVLVPCALAQTCVVLGLVIAAHRAAGAATLIGLSTAAGALQPALAPTVRALLGELIGDHAVREVAYALESVVQELIWIAGPLLVALLVVVATPSGALVASCAACVIGTSLFVASPAVRGDRRVTRGGATATGTATATATARVSGRLRALMVPMALMGAGIGATEVGLPSLALHAGSRSASGLLLATWSAGSIVGGLLYGARSWRRSLPERHRRLLVAAVACAVPLIAARTIPEGAIGALLAGLTISPVFSCQYALAGRSVIPGAETEAFTWVSAALVTGIAGGSALGGAIIPVAGVGGPFVLACGVLALAAISSLRVEQPVRATA